MGTLGDKHVCRGADIPVWLRGLEEDGKKKAVEERTKRGGERERERERESMCLTSVMMCCQFVSEVPLPWSCCLQNTGAAGRLQHWTAQKGTGAAAFE